MQDRSEQPTLYTLSPAQAQKLLAEGMNFLRQEIGSLDSGRSGSSVIPTVISTVLGTVLTAAAFSRKVMKPLRITAGIGAGASLVFGAGSGALYYGAHALNQDLGELSGFLTKLDQDTNLRQELLNTLSKHMPHGIKADGEVAYNEIVLGNIIINFGKEKGLISPKNHVDALKLSVIMDSRLEKLTR